MFNSNIANAVKYANKIETREPKYKPLNAK